MSNLIERLEMTKQINDPFPAVLYELMQEAASRLRKLEAVREAADKHTDNPDNIALFVNLSKALAACGDDDGTA